MSNQVNTSNTDDLDALVQKMDAFLIASHHERYGSTIEPPRICLVREIMRTRQMLNRPEDEKRRITHITFSYLVEMELNSVSSGFANRILFTPEYEEQTSWKSPVFRLREGAIRQYQIVSSRIAMEIFMDLLHCAKTGIRLKSKRSKLGAFKKWLCDSKNEFHYFAHVLLEAYRFDRTLRTPEVHGTPSLPSKLLDLQVPSHEEMNRPHRLTNALSNCWLPLLLILDGQKPHFMQISQEEQAWFDTYMAGSEEEIGEKLASMFEGVE
jgi:hypothetical protein